MSVSASAIAAFAVGAAAAFVFTPIVIAFARRAKVYDHPGGYHQHARPTPLLGGAALLAATVIAAAVVGISNLLVVPLIGAGAMLLIGTRDDILPVAPKWRVLAAGSGAVALIVAGQAWNTAAGGVIDATLTLVWVVGLVNSLNLMDNLDGACSTVGCVAAAGIGVLAAIKGQVAIAALALALSGACAGFLPWNLGGPARIFLGDGGSMPLGFLLAALAMAVARHSQAGKAGILVGALLVGLPILDTALVSFSRLRRGVTLMTGGRDHLSHRILIRFQSPRRVAAALGVAQAVLCGFAIAGYELGPMAAVGFAFVAFIFGVIAILVLETPRWRPAGIAIAPESVTAEKPKVTSFGANSG